MPHGVHFLLFKCILVFVMPLVYGGLETNTKHNCDTKMGTKKSIYIISKRKAYKYSQIGTNKNLELGLVETKSRQLPKTDVRDKKELHAPRATSGIMRSIICTNEDMILLL